MICIWGGYHTQHWRVHRRHWGEMQKALEKYIEALPIKRAVGDLNGEAAYPTDEAGL